MNEFMNAHAGWTKKVYTKQCSISSIQQKAVINSLSPGNTPSPAWVTSQLHPRKKQQKSDMCRWKWCRSTGCHMPAYIVRLFISFSILKKHLSWLLLATAIREKLDSNGPVLVMISASPPVASSIICYMLVKCFHRIFYIGYYSLKSIKYKF